MYSKYKSYVPYNRIKDLNFDERKELIRRENNVRIYKSILKALSKFMFVDDLVKHRVSDNDIHELVMYIINCKPLFAGKLWYIRKVCVANLRGYYPVLRNKADKFLR